MADMTIIYATVNKLPESWVKFHKRHLEDSIKGYPVITICCKPVDIQGEVDRFIQSENNLSYHNYNKYLLQAAYRVNTPYIGIAQDDTLYTPSHFNDFRPKANTVAYNRARWSVFTWDDSIFCMIQRFGGFAMIIPTAMAIDAYEERMRKYPVAYPKNKAGEIGRSRVEKRLRVKRRNVVEFYSRIPIVNLSHEYGISPPNRRKSRGQMKAYHIPYWGKPTDISRYMNGT